MIWPIRTVCWLKPWRGASDDPIFCSEVSSGGRRGTRRGGQTAPRPAAGCVQAVDIGAHFFGFVAGIAQAVHRRPQLCFGLGDLVGQLGLALFNVDQRLVAAFFGLVQGLGQAVDLVHVRRADGAEPVEDPVGKPAKPEGHEQDDRGGNDEFEPVHGRGGSLFGLGAAGGAAGLLGGRRRAERLFRFKGRLCGGRLCGGRLCRGFRWW